MIILTLLDLILRNYIFKLYDLKGKDYNKEQYPCASRSCFVLLQCYLLYYLVSAVPSSFIGQKHNKYELAEINRG